MADFSASLLEGRSQDEGMAEERDDERVTILTPILVLLLVLTNAGSLTGITARTIYDSVRCVLRDLHQTDLLEFQKDLILLTGQGSGADIDQALKIEVSRLLNSPITMEVNPDYSFFESRGVEISQRRILCALRFLRFAQMLSLMIMVNHNPERSDQYKIYITDFTYSSGRSDDLLRTLRAIARAFRTDARAQWSAASRDEILSELISEFTRQQQLDNALTESNKDFQLLKALCQTQLPRDMTELLRPVIEGLGLTIEAGRVITGDNPHGGLNDEGYEPLYARLDALAQNTEGASLLWLRSRQFDCGLISIIVLYVFYSIPFVGPKCCRAFLPSDSEKRVKPLVDISPWLARAVVKGDFSRFDAILAPITVLNHTCCTMLTNLLMVSVVYSLVAFNFYWAAALTAAFWQYMNAAYSAYSIFFMPDKKFRYFDDWFHELFYVAFGQLGNRDCGDYVAILAPSIIITILGLLFERWDCKVAYNNSEYPVCDHLGLTMSSSFSGVLLFIFFEIVARLFSPCLRPLASQGSISALAFIERRKRPQTAAREKRANSPELLG